MIPTKRQDKLDWIQTHLPVWTANASDIGLTSDQVSQLQALFTAADSAWSTAKTSRIESRNDTLTSNAAWTTMNAFFAALIKAIRSHAQATGSQEVYALAGIDPPAPPKPMPAPGMPTDVTTTIDNTGRIILRWKSTNSAPSTGAAFSIRRKLSTQTAYTVIATAQGRTYTDDSVPEGVASASYIIQGLRGNTAGQPSEPVIVYFHSIDSAQPHLSLAA